ncbi:hypothetical protein SR70_06625 [Klebsiella aerogenes]|uniref:hypothetical protein n=1 Tax=Klebsiella aerogenes TaxID=548 RepID=UPI0005ED7EDE|nr:hypothetical protein [Klebsiella aerogenes]KJP43142.1 hypothetical protein SR70_06625 [Klebsiella aerogenes]
MSLVIEASKVVNKITFQVDKNALAASKKAIASVTEFSNKQKLYEKPLKQLEANSKAAAKTVEKALGGINAKAGKPAKGDVAAIRAKVAAEKQAAAEAKKAAQATQRQERAEIKLIEGVQRVKNIQGLTNNEILQYSLELSKVSKQYQRQEISLQRMNHLQRQITTGAKQQATANNKAKGAGFAKLARSGKAGKSGSGIGGSVLSTALGVASGVGIATAATQAIAGTIHAGEEAFSSQAERADIIKRARLGNVNYNALQALSAYAGANGIDSGVGTQGMYKLLDNLKDVQDRIGSTLNQATLKKGKYVGGDSTILSALNDHGFSMDDLKKYQKNPLGFVSAFSNTLEKEGKSEQQRLATLEALGDDLGLYAKGFANSSKLINDQGDILRKNGVYLDDEQQERLEAYQRFTQDFNQATDSFKYNFVDGVLSQFSAKDAEDFKDALLSLVPIFRELGIYAGQLLKLISKFINVTAEAGHALVEKPTGPAQYNGKTYEEKPKAAPKPLSRQDQYYEDHGFFANIGHDVRQLTGNTDARDAMSIADYVSGNQYSAADMLRNNVAARPQAGPQNVQVQLVVPTDAFKVDVAPSSQFGDILHATVQGGLNDYEQSQNIAINSALLHGF